MRLMVLALLCGCNASNDGKDTDQKPEKEVDDGWPTHVFTAYNISEEDGTDSRLAACAGKLAYQTWEYEGDAELTLLLTPGRTEYTDKYHHVVRQLVEDMELPWDVVIWDPYGQGRSDGIRAHINNWDNGFVCGLDTIIHTTVDRGTPLALVSHSMGGLITTRWLQQNPGEVVAAVFSAPLMRILYPGFTEAGVCIVAAGGLPAIPTDPFEQRPECSDPLQDLTHDCDQYELFYRDPITEIGPQTWGWLSSACGGLADMRTDAPAVTDDFLILQAGIDKLVDSRGQDEMCDLINDNNGYCEISLYPNDFHEIFQEVDREQAVEEAVAFIQERVP